MRIIQRTSVWKYQLRRCQNGCVRLRYVCRSERGLKPGHKRGRLAFERRYVTTARKQRPLFVNGSMHKEPLEPSLQHEVELREQIHICSTGCHDVSNSSNQDVKRCVPTESGNSQNEASKSIPAILLLLQRKRLNMQSKEKNVDALQILTIDGNNNFAVLFDVPPLLSPISGHPPGDLTNEKMA